MPFILSLKLFLYFTYLNFCPDFLVMWENGLRIGIFQNVCHRLYWENIITKHILLNVSISESNLTMKLRQSLEYKMRNIFLQKS